MIPLSGRYQAAVDAATAFRPVLEVIARRGSLLQTLTVRGGIITDDGRRRQRLSADLQVIVADPPTAAGGLLTPFGTELSLRAGVRLSDDTAGTVPWGTRMLVTGVSGPAESGGVLSVQALDPSERLVRYRWEEPHVGITGDLADVLCDAAADRGADCALDTTGTTLVKQIIWGLETSIDPWEELSRVAEARGWVLRYRRDGVLTIDQTDSATLASARTVVLSLPPVLDFRDQPANILVARFDPISGTPQVGIATDDNPSSPTYVDGPYGRVTRFFASGLEVSAAGAQQAAESLLARERFRGASWQWTLRGWDPSIEPGDLLRTVIDGRTVQIIVDAVTLDADRGVTLVEGRQRP